MPLPFEDSLLLSFLPVDHQTLQHKDASEMTAKPDDSFELFDLRVEVVAPAGAKLYCGAKIGDYFELKGEMLHLPAGQGFSIYSLASVLPLLAAKQRITDSNDWMATDAEIACPDPHCPSRLRITRIGKRRFSHADTTVVPLGPDLGH
jgi:uncharacterized repeat protein (TIGR04076 family)